MALTAEEIAASPYFDADAYVEAKARIMVLNGKANSHEDAKAQFLSKWTGDMSEHYLNYGAAENVNPSNDFDNSDYIAQVAAAEGVTYQELKADWEAQGIAPLEHFIETGEDLGYTAPPVSADEQVDVGDTPVVEGDDILLTSDTDRGGEFDGTAGDDTFEAPIVQNQWAGGVSNSLSTADRINGGDGEDSLHAELVPEFFGVTGDNEMEIQPRITEVEDITFEAMDVTTTEDNKAITVDAKNIKDVDHIGSAYSDGDLVIENLTTLTSDGVIRNTDAITITMDHTDNFNSDGDASDLTVLFDEDYLIAGESVEGSTLVIRMLNAVNNVNDENPIEGTTSFDFYVGGTPVTVDISSIASDDTLDYTTAYDAVVDAINAQLGDDFPNVRAEKLPLADAVFSIPVETYSVGDDAGDYYPILVSNSGPEELTRGQFQTTQLEYDTDQNNSMTAQDPEINDDPLGINIELHKVGRDNDGGNLEIGGKHDESIPNFYVSVLGEEDKPSNLGELRTTGGGLENVYISTHEDYVDGLGVEDVGVASLTIRGLPGDEADGPFDQASGLDLVDADDFLGDLTLGNAEAVANLQTLTAQGGGDVAFYGNYTDATGVNSDTGIDFSVTTGAGDDTIDLDIDGDAVDAKGESMAVVTGAGDDDITVDVDNGVSQATMAELENLSIDSGAGNDEINMMNIGNWDVDAGSGDDTVYVANNGNDDDRAAVNEIQTITFGAAGDVDTQGQVTVTLSNGQSFTTVGLLTDDTPATVADAVVAAFNAADTAAGLAALAADGAETAALAALNAALGTPGEAAAQTAYDAAVAAAVVANAIADDYTAITIGNVIGDEVTLEYGPAYSDGPDVPMATVAGILTDSAIGVPVETTPGADGTDAADATAEVVVISSAGTSADGATVTIQDSVSLTTDTINLVDTDGNGVVSSVEFAAQMAAATYTDFVVTGSNETLGEVYLEAKVAQTSSATVAGSADEVKALGGTDNDGNAIVAADGTDAIPFAAGIAEVQTITVTNGADQAGIVTMGIDIDADGTVDADEIFTFSLTAGNEGEVAAQLATQINALAGVSAVQGAGALIDEVAVTWDLKTDASDNADQAAADITFVDGAVRSVSVAETQKGLEGTDDDVATWLVNYNGTDIVDNDDTSGMGAGALDLLFGAQLTVTYSGATTDGASGVIAGAAVADDNGFESTVEIETDDYVGNFVNINDAIMAAITGDGVNGGASGANVLEELLSVREGNLESLIIESVIDGEFNEADLAITMQAADVEDMTNSQKSGIVAALQELDGDSEATYTDAQIQTRLDAAVEAFTTSSALDNLAMATSDGVTLLAGSPGTTENDSTVELGTDDDVIVLSTHDDSNNTLVYEGFGNGHDTVVNFTETGAAMDMIDFSSYLDAQTSASGSAVTAVDYAQTLNLDTTANLDEVTIINDFAQDLGDLTITSDDETWAGLDADKLLAALHNDNTDAEDAWGNIQEADLDVASITDLVGETYNHIVMVENDLNDGEYKVFLLVAEDATDNADADFMTPQLIGVVDFGDTLANLTDANFA